MVDIKARHTHNISTNRQINRQSDRQADIDDRQTDEQTVKPIGITALL